MTETRINSLTSGVVDLDIFLGFGNVDKEFSIVKKIIEIFYSVLRY